MADTLATMFPGRPRAELQAALDANAGSLEAAVEYLLRPSPPSTTAQQATPSGDSGLGDQPTIVYDTGNAIADRARARQLEEDEIMARALALEEEQTAANNPFNAVRYFANGVINQVGGAGGGEGRGVGAGRGPGGGDAADGGAGMSLPSMEQVGAAVAPVVAGLQTAGRTAVDIVSGLYDDLVGSDTTSRPGSGYASVDAQQQQVLAARRRAAEADRASTSVVRGDGGASPRRPGLQQRRTGLVDGAGASAGDKKRE